MKRFSVILATVVLLLGYVPVMAQPAALVIPPFKKARFSHPLRIDNPYFPLVVGTTYVYRGKSEGSSTYEELVVTRRTEVVSGVRARVVQDTSWQSGQLVELTFDWYAQDDDGNVWYLGEDTTEYQNGKVTGHEGSWRAGTDGAVPGYIMEAHPSPGDAYRQEYYKDNAEDAAKVLSTNESTCVTYGCFSNVVETEETTRLEPGTVEHKYYAAGVGEIRSIVVQGGTEENHLVKVNKP